MNHLYYGDNLEVLQRYVKDETVDVVYLDPPFNSNANYNVLFSERDGKASAAQIKAFADTWRWDSESVTTFQRLVEEGGALSETLQALRMILRQSDLLAYITMMAPRLRELHRVLKPTGSLYLHCDPTAGHYLKLILDVLFGPQNFRNEIIWKRTSAHSSSKRYGPVHDIIYFYTRSGNYVWNPQFVPYDKEYIAKFYRHISIDGRAYKLGDLTGAGTRNGLTGQTWRGVDVTAKGRHWMVPPEELDKLDEQGLVYWPSKGGMPRLISYLEDMPGVALQDVIDDITPIGAHAAERLGYPTQKPLQLLERLLNASSNPGDLVLDPFCGCGTTIDAAQRLDRRWIGIDITHLAVNLIKHRLYNTYGDSILEQYSVVGEPVSLPDAESLAAQDPYQFQWWALGLVGARPVDGKKGADKGIDGRLFFHDDDGSKAKQIIFSVKAGKPGVTHVRDLHGVLQREKAEIGVLITFHPPTQQMRSEAAEAGFYRSAWGQHGKIQLLTISELLSGKRIDMPPRSGHLNVTFKRARRYPNGAHEQGELYEVVNELGTNS